MVGFAVTPRIPAPTRRASSPERKYDRLMLSSHGLCPCSSNSCCSRVTERTSAATRLRRKRQSVVECEVTGALSGQASGRSYGPGLRETRSPGSRAWRFSVALLLLGDEADQLSPGMQSEFLHEMRAMRLDGTQRDTQCLGHLGIGVAQGEQLKHLLLPGGQREQRVATVAARDLVPPGQRRAQ